jgi:hypothetical protein
MYKHHILIIINMATTEETLKEVVESNGCIFVKRCTEASQVRAGTNHRRVRTYVVFICKCQMDIPLEQQEHTKKQAEKIAKACRCKKCGRKKQEETCQKLYGVTNYIDIVNANKVNQ